jgi:hypothetical protein
MRGRDREGKKRERERDLHAYILCWIEREDFIV